MALHLGRIASAACSIILLVFVAWAQWQANEAPGNPGPDGSG
jgi:hypothetical protein